MSIQETFISSLMQILNILAASPDDQLEYLRSIGGASVDELGLEFEEVWLMADSILESNGINGCQYDRIKKLNETLDGLSENAWAEEALVENAEWELIRNMAKDCIKSFSNN